MLVTLILQGITMIKVEKSDPFSSESHRLIEMLSAELAAITGDNGKAISPPKQWVMTKLYGH